MIHLSDPHLTRHYSVVMSKSSAKGPFGAHIFRSFLNLCCFIFNISQEARTMPQALQVVNGRERIKRARILLVLSSVWCIASMFLMVLARLLPPSDAVCDQRNLVFSPLQSAIRYDWVNYGDMWAQGSRYRTSFNTSISEDTDRAWLELLAGKVRSSAWDSNALLTVIHTRCRC